MANYTKTTIGKKNRIELHEKLSLTGAEISLSTGDWIKIAPAAKRQFFASDISGITYICIQVKENSLKHFTAEDAVIG